MLIKVLSSVGSALAMGAIEPCGIVDLLQGIWIVGEMVGELELKSVSDLGPKLLWEATGEGLALFCGGNMIFGIAINSLWYLPKLASDEIPTLEASPTYLLSTNIFWGLTPGTTCTQRLQTFDKTQSRRQTRAGSPKALQCHNLRTAWHAASFLLCQLLGIA